MKMGAVFAATLVLAACAAAPNGAADPPQPPFPIGQVGSPVHAKAASGATADVTLNSAKWFPEGCAGGWSCNVIELTIAGTSSKPFNYDDTFVVAGYGGGDQPFTHPNDDHWLGASYMVNYEQIKRLPPLRKGSVTAGQTAHGFVGYGLQDRGDVYVEMIDPDTEHPLEPGPFGVVEVGWKVHT